MVFGKGDSVGVRRGGVRWLLDLKEGIDFSIYLLGGFEPGTLRLYKTVVATYRPQVVFDIGANVGAHTLPLANLVAGYGGRVYAFEPTRWAYEKLLVNIQLNPDLAGHIVPIQAMLVAHDNEAVEPSIYSSWPLSDSSDLHPVHRGQSMSTSGASAIPLDHVVKEQKLERLDFIKLDVDGHEPEVLTGGWASIEAYKPIVMMEWSPHLFEDRPDVMHDALNRFLTLGYSVLDGSRGMDIRGGAAMLDEMTPAGGSMNIMLIPRSRMIQAG